MLPINIKYYSLRFMLSALSRSLYQELALEVLLYQEVVLWDVMWQGLTMQGSAICSHELFVVVSDDQDQ